MRKRVVSLLLLIILCLAFIVPTSAEEGILPYSIPGVTAGMRHSSGDDYVMYGTGTCALDELQFVSATLYQYIGSGYHEMTSVYKSEVNSVVTASKTVPTLKNNKYKVVAVARNADGESKDTYYKTT